MTLRAACFDFQDTLAYFVDGHYALYVQAARECGVAVTREAVSQPLDDAWAAYRTPLGIDHSAASADERSFNALRATVHRHRLEAAGVGAARSEAIARRLLELEAQPQHYRLFDDALPALERLRAAGLRALVVSNHIWRLPEVADALGLGRALDGVLTSARVGVRKPHPRIYQQALRLAGCEPGEALFVGDSRPHDVEGPRAAGMSALLLERGEGERPAGVIRSLAELPLA